MKNEKSKVDSLPSDKVAAENKHLKVLCERQRREMELLKRKMKELTRKLEQSQRQQMSLEQQVKDFKRLEKTWQSEQS